MSVVDSVIPAPTASRRMSEEEYLAWAGSDICAEWVAGEVQFKMSVHELHDVLQAAIRSAMEALVRRKSLGSVRGPEFSMRLDDRPSYREPDILFVAKDSKSRLTPTRLYGPSDLAVEIVSPDSIARDYRQKFNEYEQAGIREYWLIDPLQKLMEAHRLDSDGNYQPIAPDSDGKLHSAVISGWWLSTAVLFKEPTPDALELIQLLGIV